jgi:hypothetical protein
MPGLVPGILLWSSFVIPGRELRERTRNLEIPGSCFAHPGMTMSSKFLFIIFVDAIFTTLFERAFTKLFDVIAAIRASSCV